MVDKKQLAEAIKKAKETSEKRKFTQSLDLIITLKDFDAKKTKFEEHAVLPNGVGKPVKIAAFVGGESKEEAEQLCDLVILDAKLSQYTDKRKARKLARQYDFIISQANIMPEIAKHLGKYLAPLGKMPNPKFGMIFPPKASVKLIVAKLKDTVMLATKKAPVIQCRIGTDAMDDAKLADNAFFVVDFVTRKLPQNMSKIMVKTTMGRPVRV